MTAQSKRLVSAALIAGLVGAALALALFDESLRTSIDELSSPGLTPLMIASSRYGGPGLLVPRHVGVPFP